MRTASFWNLGFFHVHEQQRYALLNVRVLSFRERERVFFTRFSRKLSHMTADLLEKERRHPRRKTEIETLSGVRANVTGSV